MLRPRKTLEMALFLVWAWVLGIASVTAHSSSDGFLFLNGAPGRLDVRLDLAVRDLDVILPVDADGNGDISWGELRSMETALKGYVDRRLQLAANGRKTDVAWQPLKLARHSDSVYVVLMGQIKADRNTERWSVDYDLLFHVDRDHRGLVSLQYAGSAATEAVVLSPLEPHLDWQPGGAKTTGGWTRMLMEGMHHIWTGYDHLLFLLALLLPSVARRNSTAGWTWDSNFREVTRRVLRVVTAFTAAHSLTLALAALGWARLPSRGVESVIALSVAAAALNNLRPFFRHQAVMMAFGFGLIHGFGFASALSGLDLSGDGLLRGLIGFNCGVELGQLTLVALFLPIAYAMRRSWCYQRLAVLGGSTLILGVAGGWLVERSLDLKFMPF